MATEEDTGIALRDGIMLPMSAVSWNAIRAQGAGGQNVNKVSSAIHMRFDVGASPLPEDYKERLLTSRDRRMNSDGVLVIKAQRFRSQEKNLDDAMQRLRQFILSSTEVQRTRKRSRPSAASKRRRVDDKRRHGQLKRGRRQLDE